jgi:hypothetical protein
VSVSLPGELPISLEITHAFEAETAGTGAQFRAVDGIIRQEPRQHRQIGIKLKKRRMQRFSAGRCRSMKLKECDQKSVAVVVAIQGVQQILRGKASYFSDPTLGNCLRIAIVDPESVGVELLLRESEWSGTIAPDTEHGCDAVVYLDQNRCPS